MLLPFSIQPMPHSSTANNPFSGQFAGAVLFRIKLCKYSAQPSAFDTKRDRCYESVRRQWNKSSERHQCADHMLKGSMRMKEEWVRR